MARRNSNILRVYEFGGTARSGKGTAVAGLKRVHPEIATDETGADYRAVTRGLLSQELINREMPREDIQKVILDLGAGALVDLVARRQELEKEFGESSLHDADVNETVHHVSPLEVVRGAVKDGFRKRVETVRDTGTSSVLLVDGRNLAKVIEQIPGTRLVMRTFVYCEPYEAARRECLRSGLLLDDPSWDEAYIKAYNAIFSRNSMDKNRVLDPVVPDKECIDYWSNQSLLDITMDVYARLAYGGNKAKAVRNMLIDGHDNTRVGRIGAGIKAVTESRQVHFDTTPFRQYSDPVQAMNLAVSKMFDEAKTTDEMLHGVAA